MCKNIVSVVLLSGLIWGFLACTSMRYAQTGIRGALTGEKTITHEWGEVYCSQGVVCAEVEVLRVDVEEREGGRVRVTFKNRTGQNIALQVHLQIIDANGVVLKETRPENLAIARTQEKIYEMPGIYHPGAKVRIMLGTLN